MIDEPKTDGERQETEQAKAGLSGPGTPLSDAPAPASPIPSRQGPKNPEHIASTIARTLVAIWGIFKLLLGFLDRHEGSITALATVAIVFLTFVYVKYSKKQWETMQESNRINREALVSVQRAFVTFSTAINFYATVGPRTKKVISWDFSIPFENSGVTPTRDMRMLVTSYPSVLELSADFSYPDGKGAKTQLIVVGPKQKSGTVQFGNVSPNVMDDVRRRRQHLYFYGWAAYHDVFNNTPLHVTKFCYELVNFSADPFTALGPFNSFFNACAHHNCVDEECNRELVTSPP